MATREETARMIEVMQAYVDGEEIEVKLPTSAGWVGPQPPSWRWGDLEYRVKPKKLTIQDVIDYIDEHRQMVPYEVWSFSELGPRTGISWDDAYEAVGGSFDAVWRIYESVAEPLNGSIVKTGGVWCANVYKIGWRAWSSIDKTPSVALLKAVLSMKDDANV